MEFDDLKNGCPYGGITRQMVKDILKGMEEMKKTFTKCHDENLTEIRKLDERTTKMFNHLSNRIHPTMAIVISILTALVGALGGVVLSKIILC
jgi:hypothetical protein